MAIHLLGIRHHGPGSARNVLSYLEALKPDIVLVEGPPEGDALLQWAGHEDLKPPVALLCYVPDAPKQATFYPFAEFSPEWVAIRYAVQHQIPVRFFDLPAAHQFALEKEAAEASVKDEGFVEIQSASPDEAIEEKEFTEYDIKADPVSYLAEAAGYEDGEKWWEQVFEYRRYLKPWRRR
jgi:hypothetical protein